MTTFRHPLAFALVVGATVAFCFETTLATVWAPQPVSVYFKNYCKGKFIFNILEDHTGRLWLNGVFNQALCYYNREEDQIIYILTADDRKDAYR